MLSPFCSAFLLCIYMYACVYVYHKSGKFIVFVVDGGYVYMYMYEMYSYVNACALLNVDVVRGRSV